MRGSGHFNRGKEEAGWTAC